MSGPTVITRSRSVVAGLGVLALAAAACGGASTASTKPASNQSPTTTAPANPPGAFGSVAAVSGSTLEVQNPTTGQVTVNVTPTTTFTQTVPGAASDLAAGVCVAANAGQGVKAAPGQSFTARTVAISQPGANGCTPGAGGFGGFGPRAGNGGAGGSTTTAPANNRNPNRNGARRPNGAFGKVASVSGPSFVVQRTDRNGANTTTTVTTDSSTTFTKVVSASQSTLANGQCVAALGPADQTGAVTANSIAIRPPGPNGCFTGNRGGQGAPGGGNGGAGSPT
jgi:Domain of unknown function (DUF5666)